MSVDAINWYRGIGVIVEEQVITVPEEPYIPVTAPVPIPEETEEEVTANSYQIKFVSLSYRSTSEGKTLDASILVSKVKPLGPLMGTLFLQAKREDGTITDIKQKSFVRTGMFSEKFSFHIPDLTFPTALITVESFLWLSETTPIPLAQTISEQLAINETGRIPIAASAKPNIIMQMIGAAGFVAFLSAAGVIKKRRRR